MITAARYKGISSLDIEERKLKEIARQAFIKTIDDETSRYFKQHWDLTRKHLKIAGDNIFNEIELPTPKVADYFKRNLKRKVENNTPPLYTFKPDHVRNQQVLPKSKTYLQTICNDELIQRFLNSNRGKLAVSISTSGSATRIINVLSSIVDDAKESDFEIFLVVGVNETLDNTVDQILEFAEKKSVATIVNEIPFGALQGYSVQNRTTSLNLNLYTIREQYKLEKDYLAIIDDDILFPPNSRGNLRKLAEFLRKKNIKVTSATSIPYPMSFFNQLSNKEAGYYHPIFYENLIYTYTIDLQNNIPPRPNVHGGCMLMRLKDHPLYAPSEETFHDLWLTEYFQKDLIQNQTMRCNEVFIYHHEPTCLISWIAKWKRILKMIQPYKRRNPAMDKKINRLIDIRFRAIAENLSKDKQALAMFVFYEFIKRNSLKLYLG